MNRINCPKIGPQSHFVTRNNLKFYFHFWEIFSVWAIARELRLIWDKTIAIENWNEFGNLNVVID